MKTIITTAAFIGALVLPGLAMATSKSSASAMSFPEFVEAVGCVLVDQGGYSTVEAVGGGFCAGMAGHVAPGTSLVSFDPDGIPASGDEYRERVRDDN